ncbi:MAG: polysaccharide deacetylase family protein [Peptococcaceae bacterium]|nr:polysaccharide deacetylase family protein [Peptococcaceae bacterium]
MAQSKKNSRNERMIYTVITVLTISAGIITGVWLGRGAETEIEDVSAEAKEIPIYFVETDEKKLAISFDAAWGCEHTQQILDILAAHDIKATFFLTNIWLEEYPDMAKTIADAGHEIGMHSVSHPHMPELSAAQIQEELQGNYDLIVETTQFKPDLFRFPFGDYDNKSMQIVQQK